MGFFGDLKQDLSQAVEELLPEGAESGEGIPEEVSNAGEEAVVPADAAVSEEIPADESIDLNALLEEALGNLPDGPEEEIPAGESFPEEIPAGESFPEEIPAEGTDAEPEIDLSALADDLAAEAVAEEAPAEEAFPEEVPAEEAVSEEIPTQADVDTFAPEDAARDLAAVQVMGDAIDEAFASMESGEEYVTDEDPAAESFETEPNADLSAENENTSKGAEIIMDSLDEKDYSEETSVITGGMKIDGNLNTQGSLDLLGGVNGDLVVGGKLNVTGSICGNSKAREIYAENAKISGDLTSESSVKIGSGTVIIGNITALSAAIAGAVKGDIDVHGPVILDATAIVMGNIKSKSVQINNGATLEGNCSQCYADVSPTSFFDEYKPEKKKADKADK